MANEASPRPWRIDDSRDHIVDADGKNIMGIEDSVPPDERFIVNAVNSFEAMRAALDRLLYKNHYRQLSHHKPEWVCVYCGAEHCDVRLMEHKNSCPIEAGEAALALGEGAVTG